MSHRRTLIGISAVVLLCASTGAPAQSATSPDDTFWASRDVRIPADPKVPVVRIAIWDSGVDTTLFDKQLARDPNGQPIVRGKRPPHAVLVVQQRWQQRIQLGAGVGRLHAQRRRSCCGTIGPTATRFWWKSSSPDWS